MDIFPLTADLNLEVSIYSVSILLGVFFGIFIGYAIGKIVRLYSTKTSSQIGWFSYALVLDLIITVGISIGLIFAVEAMSPPDLDLIVLKLAGAAFIFVGVSIVTLFIPMITGSFVVFSRIDKMFFPKKYVDF